MRYICTTGTFIGQALGEFRPFNFFSEPAKFRDTVGQRCAQLWRENPERFLNEVSAEMNGLARGDVERGTMLCCYAAAKLCVDLVAGELSQCLDRIRVMAVEGLQVKDPVRFRWVGVPKLFEALDELTKDVLMDEVRLHVDSGLKGVVPFVILFAMFRDLAVSYVFERSDREILLPSFPVELDWDRYAPAAEALLNTGHACALSKAENEGLLPPGELVRKQAFCALYEPCDDRKYTLRYWVILFWDAYRR